ncbi:MAG: hypothetical protein JWR45_462 [Blastococcus sp.]|jgi:acyl-CoA dehydrogenase|nr:hypothetical protein [Blastococcus sp.]
MSEIDEEFQLRELRLRAQKFFTDDVLPLEQELQAGAPMTALFPELQARAKAAGLWQFDVPREYGGQGLGLRGSCIVAEEAERSPVVPLRQNEAFGPRGTPILFAASAEQQRRYLEPVLRGELKTCFAQTEPGAGSDPAGMSTTARREGDEYVLNGVKRYIGGAAEADFAQVICLVEPTSTDSGSRVFACLLVDMRATGVTLQGPIDTLTGDETWQITFAGVRVPVEDRVGAEGDGFTLGQAWLTHGRIRNHGARCVGMARRAMELMMERATSRQTFGSALGERQAIQFYVADSYIDIETARLLTSDTAARYDRGADVRDLSYAVKIYCTEMAQRVVDRSIQVHGAVGLRTDFPLESFYRQIRSLRITEGATEVLRWRLARNVMRGGLGAAEGAGRSA